MDRETTLFKICTGDPNCILCRKNSESSIRCPVYNDALRKVDNNKIMRILQLKLNHCEAAQDLLSETVSELKIDVGAVFDN